MTEIHIIDDEHPEDNAMMQALYSRSPKSVVDHRAKVREVGSGNFMGQYYVGYNHASIGDCGSTTIYIENVSMLVAKAIQDTPLYRGQEASTRYMDMTRQGALNPLGTLEGKEVQDRWMSFYSSSMAPQIQHLTELYPCQGEDSKEYTKAIKTRAFDVLRGFLPAGCRTYVSWHSDLRQAADHLANLRYYPVREVRETAHKLLFELQDKYPHSFGHKRYEATEQYLALANVDHLYDPNEALDDDVVCEARLISGSWWEDPILKDRPPHCRLPHRYDSLGQVAYRFLLDFGSFRDLQRHRNGVCRMPLLRTRWGFNQWYLDNLAPALVEEAAWLLERQTAAIQALPAPDSEKQHYVAMGYNVPCHVTRGLPGTLYLIELRSGAMVHPTLRVVAQKMASALRTLYPELTIHEDKSPDAWSIRRGSQDIEAK